MVRSNFGQDWEGLPVAPFVPVLCPRCRESKPITYGQSGRLRYHQCKRCGDRFKSWQIDPGEAESLPSMQKSPS